jgi:hypothetical protein
MKTVKIYYKQAKPWKWNADKALKVFVDGESIGRYWDLTKDEVCRLVHRMFSVKRVKCEVHYGEKIPD